MTAWSHAEASAWTAGADRFISKPFHPDELTAAVEELLAPDQEISGVGSKGRERL